MIWQSLQLIGRRSLAHWRLLLAVIVGILLAVSIMSATVVYFNALRDLALHHDLAQVSPGSLDVVVAADQSPVNPAKDKQIRDFVQPIVKSRLGWIASNIEDGTRSATFYVGNEGDHVPPLATDTRRAAFVVLDGIENHAKIVSGEWPAVTPPAKGDGLRVDAAVSQKVAAEFHLKVGDVFTAVPYWDAAHPQIQARVVGIYQEQHSPADYWAVYDQALGFADSSFQYATFVVPRATLTSAIGPFFPGMSASYTWFVNTDPARIRASASGRAQADLTSVSALFSANLNGFRLQTHLGDVLAQFETRLFYNKIPMFVVMVLIVLVVLYYISTIASLLVQAQREEIGLIRIRGATSRQILFIYAIEAFVLTAIAIPLGPYIAAGAITSVGAVPLFADLNHGHAIPVEVTATVFRMSAIGGALSLLALLIPSLQAARLGLLQHRLSIVRPPRLPAFQRYYLDLVVLGIVLFFFWQLEQRGSFVATRLFGKAAVNQIVLAVPAMFLVAAGLVLLRVFPVAMEFLGRLLSTRVLSRVASPALVLGLWQMARNPSHHSRLSLLLILTAALGVFAASFRGSLEQSFKDQSLYQVGADISVSGVRLSPEEMGRTVYIEDQLKQVSGVGHVSPLLRRQGSLVAGIGQTFNMLAVDPSTISSVAWTRPDFASAPISQEIQKLNVPDTTGITIPADAAYLYLRIRSNGAPSDAQVIARFSDADSRLFSLNLGSPSGRSADPAFTCEPATPKGPSPWCEIGASLDLLGSYASPPLKQPLKLEFLGVTKLSGKGNLDAGSIDIDEIAVRMKDGTDRVLDNFDNLQKWGSLGTTLNHFGGSIAPERDKSGAPVPGVARFSWGGAQQRVLQGVLAGKLQQTVPVLVSPGFLALSDYHVGDNVDVLMNSTEVLFHVVGVVDYFPTMDPNQSPFVIADIGATWRALGVDQLGAARDVDEYWISTSGVSGAANGGSPASMAAVAQGVQNTLNDMNVRYNNLTTETELLNRQTFDPLAAAGWRALLAIAFFAVLVVSAIGFLVHAQVTFQGRRSEFALLRAVGLSIRQLFGLILLEQLLVICVALGIGIFMGARLGQTILPFISTSGSGLKTVPPMVQHVDWASFGVTFGIVGGVFLLVIAVLLVAVNRMSIHRVLRLGER